MPPFGKFFGKKEPELSPEVILRSVLEGSHPQEDSVRKVFSPEMRNTVESFIASPFSGDRTIKILSIYAESNRLSEIVDVINRELGGWIEEDWRTADKVMVFFDAHGVKLETDNLSFHANERVKRIVAKQEIHDLWFAEFLEMTDKHNIPIDVEIIKAKIDEKYIREHMEVRQFEGLKEITDWLSKKGVPYVSNKYISSIKAGFEYAMHHDYLDGKFVENIKQGLNLAETPEEKKELQDHFILLLNKDSRLNQESKQRILHQLD